MPHPHAAAGLYPADVRGLWPRRSNARRWCSSARRRRRTTCAGATGWPRTRWRCEGTRGIGKSDMIHNSATPQIEVNPETYEVRADGDAADLRTGKGIAAGAAVFPVLIRNDLRPSASERSEMPDLPPARTLLRRSDRLAVVMPADRVTLGYDARFLRRKRLTSDSGARFLVDLPETVSLNAGDCFRSGRWPAGRGRGGRRAGAGRHAAISPVWPGTSATATRPARSKPAAC